MWLFYVTFCLKDTDHEGGDDEQSHGPGVTLSGLEASRDQVLDVTQFEKRGFPFLHIPTINMSKLTVN